MNIKRGHRRAIQAELSRLQGSSNTASNNRNNHSTNHSITDHIITKRKENLAYPTSAPNSGTHHGKMMHINRNIINFHTTPMPPVSTNTVITNRAAARTTREPSVSSSLGSRRKYRRRVFFFSLFFHVYITSYYINSLCLSLIKKGPKPDPNAPEKPVSAYVAFSNSVREEIQAQGKSFSEIAKCVGERWKQLPMLEKERLETRAARAKDSYLSELAHYKCTPEYQEYQRYLTRFYRQHSSAPAPSSGNTDEEIGTPDNTSGTNINRQRLIHHNLQNLQNLRNNGSNGNMTCSSPTPSTRGFPLSSASCLDDPLGSSISSSGASAARTTCTSRDSPRAEDFSEDDDRRRNELRSSSLSTNNETS